MTKQQEFLEKLEKSYKKFEKFNKFSGTSFKNRLIRLFFYPNYYFNRFLKGKLFQNKTTVLFGDKKINLKIKETSFLLLNGILLELAEYKLTKFFIKNLKDDDIFIDGGANIGYYTLLANKLVGNNGKVISFEPTPSAFKILKKNTEGKTNIILEEKALLNKIGEIKFIDYGLKNSPFNSVIKRTTILENQGKEINVESITLDEYCFKNNIKPTFIKLLN